MIIIIAFKGADAQLKVFGDIIEPINMNLVNVNKGVITEVAEVIVERPGMLVISFQPKLNKDSYNQLTNLIRDFNSAWVKASMDYDFSKLETYLEEDSSIWEDGRDYFYNLQKNNIKYNEEMLNIRFIELNVVSSDEVEIRCEEEWKSQKIGSDAFGNSYKPTHRICRWVYTVKRCDGRWLLTDSTLVDKKEL